VVLYQRAGGGKAVAPGKQTWSVNGRDICEKVKYSPIPKQAFEAGPEQRVYRSVHRRNRDLASDVWHYQMFLQHNCALLSM
jgi:hypothetical protein